MITFTHTYTSIMSFLTNEKKLSYEDMNAKKYVGIVTRRACAELMHARNCVRKRAFWRIFRLSIVIPLKR